MFQYKKNDIVITLLLALLYYSTALLSSFIFANTSIISTGVFIPEGIALAFALYFGPKVVPGIFIGQLIFALLNTHLFFFSFTVSLVNSLEALLAIFLFQKFKIDIRLRNFRDIVATILLIILILQPFSAIISNIFIYFNENIAMNKLLLNIFSWWFGNSMGQILYTPFLLLFLTQYKNIVLREYLFYGLLYGSVTFLLIFILQIQNLFLIMSITLPLLIFIIFQKSVAYGTMLNIVLSLIISLSFIGEGIGAFQTDSHFNNTLNYNIFLLAHVLISLTVGTLFEQKRRYEEELENIIEEEIQKNKEQQLLLIQQSRLAQMGEMISMIAHQWRQPLNNLALINQLLIVKYNKNELDDKSLEYFKKNSKKQIDLMSTTIDDFRNFFRPENEKKELEIQSVLQTLFEMTRPIYTSHSIVLTANIEEGLKIYGYPNALAQAVLNIINNAKDVLIEREVKNKEIILNARRIDDEEIIIEIQDNAGGIKPDIIDKIFDPYFTTKQDKNGTGLGLYMTKKIIEEQLEAKISVKNNKNGALFTIYLKGQK